MTCAVCPNCGLDLQRLEPFTRGDLDVGGDFSEVRWKGQLVYLSATERCLVIALARSHRHCLTNSALAELGGFDEVKDPIAQVRVYISKIRNRFRRVDPSFAALEAVWGVGVRWAA